MSQTDIKSGNNRIPILDIVRIITAYLVIFGHLLPVDDLRNIIYLFHMPLFFLVSGMLYKQEDFKTVLNKSLKGIIVPLISFIIIPTIIYAITIGFDKCYRLLANSIYGVIFSGPIPINWVLWFLIVLFNIKLITNIILRVNPYIWVLFWGIGFLIFNKYNYFFLAQSIMAFPFFMLGYYYKKHIQQLFSKNKIINALIAILSILLMLFIYHYNGRVSVNICMYGCFNDMIIRILMFYIGALLGIYAIFVVSSFFKSSENYKAIASSLITIMCAQYLFIDLSKPITDISGIFGKTIIALLIMYACYILHKVINRYIPIILGKF